MKDQDLFQLVIQILEEYFSSRNSSTTTVEEKTLEALRPYSGLCSQEVIFVLDYVLGVCRFEKLCEGAFKGYCEAYKRNKNGRLSIYLITYVLFFKCTELGGERVRSLIHQPALATRIVEYIQYLFDLNAIQKYSLPRWLQYYDIHFLQTSVLEPFISRKSKLETDILGWYDTSSTVPQGVVNQPEDEGHQSDKQEDLQQIVKTQSNMGEAKSDAHTNTVLFKTFSVQNGEGSHHPLKFQSGKPKTSDNAHLMQLPAVLASPHRQVLLSQSLKGCSNPLETTLPKMIKKKSPTRAIVFSVLKRPLNSSPNAPDAVDRKPDPLNSVSKSIAFYIRIRDSAPPKIATTTAALRQEAYAHGKQQQGAQRSLQEGGPFYDPRNCELCETQQSQKIAQEQEAKILERHLEALEIEEKVQRAKAKVTVEKRVCIDSMKKKAEADASEKQKKERVNMHRQQELVRKFKAQLAINKYQALARCNSEKRKAAKELREERSRIQEAAQEAEEQRRLEQSQMVHEIHLLRERIKHRPRDFGKHKCATWIDGAGESIDNEGNSNERAKADVHEALARIREQDKEVEEISRQRIAAARKRRFEERQKLEQVVQMQREMRRKQWERAHELEVYRKEAVRGIMEASRAARVMDVYEKLHTKRADQLQNFRELREAERKSQNERILRNDSSDAVERERWRQLEQGLHSRVVSAQTHIKGRAASL